MSHKYYIYDYNKYNHKYNSLSLRYEHVFLKEAFPSLFSDDMRKVMIV